MATQRSNEIQEEINAVLEKLKVAKDPAERRNLLLAGKLLIAEFDVLTAKQEMPESEPRNEEV
jgi:hypothetical protein